jgi:hypothetical protein
VDQTSKTEAMRHTKQDRTRRTAKPVKAREEAQKPIDPERLSKAIQYLIGMNAGADRHRPPLSSGAVLSYVGRYESYVGRYEPRQRG